MLTLSSYSPTPSQPISRRNAWTLFPPGTRDPKNGLTKDPFQKAFRDNVLGHPHSLPPNQFCSFSQRPWYHVSQETQLSDLELRQEQFPNVANNKHIMNLSLPMSVTFCSCRLPRVYLKSARFKKKRSDADNYRKRRNCSACGLSLSATHVQDLQRAPNLANLTLFEVRSCGGKLRFCSGNVRSLCGLARLIQESCCSVQNIDRIAQHVLQRSLNSFAKQPSSWLS